jgi:hypothetical protein
MNPAQPAIEQPGRDRVLHIVAALVSLLLISVLVIRTSDAAFSATTANTGDQWSAGTVTLVDDDSNSAMFSVTNMKPGASSEHCITVTYSGSLDASVKLYGAVTAGTLGTYLNLEVYRGSGGSFAGCSGFTSAETVYNGTLAGFVAASSSFGTGAGTWTPTGGAPNDDMTYRFVVTLQDNNSAQGLTSTATFTWEAQNT